MASVADVESAVHAARAAFDGWRLLSPRKRKAHLASFAAKIREHAEELAALTTMEMGKPVSNAISEVNSTAFHLEWFGELADHEYGDVAPLGPDALGTITKVPVGVVGASVPWNCPLVMAAWTIAPALASGNTMILKPAELFDPPQTIRQRVLVDVELLRRILNRTLVREVDSKGSEKFRILATVISFLGGR